MESSIILIYSVKNILIRGGPNTILVRLLYLMSHYFSFLKFTILTAPLVFKMFTRLAVKF